MASLEGKRAAPATGTFLTGMVERYVSTEAADAVGSARSLVRDLSKKIVDDLDACTAAIATETDPDVRSALGEYEQKLGALDRELRGLREQTAKVTKIVGEIEDLETRVGAELRKP